MGSLRDRIAPRRMGPNFRWLLGSTWISNVGDGIGLAAGPLREEEGSQRRSDDLVGLVWPFAAQAVLVAGSVVLVARIATPGAGITLALAGSTLTTSPTRRQRWAPCDHVVGHQP